MVLLGKKILWVTIFFRGGGGGGGGGGGKLPPLDRTVMGSLTVFAEHVLVQK